VSAAEAAYSFNLLCCLNGISGMLAHHVTRQVAKGSIAARAHTMSDPIFDPRHNSARCRQLTLRSFSQFALPFDFVIPLGKALR
jgi:hypothetical protein